MPAAEYIATRSDGRFIGTKIRELVRRMLEGEPWQRVADELGIKRSTAYKALHKPHVIAFRREERKKLIELLSCRVPLKLSQLMDSENAAASVRACLAIEDMRNEAQAEPGTRRINTAGLVIVIGAPTQRALPAESAMPVLEMEPADE
jgi:DNA-directed RNA polymerase subunit N (RpoN/RPB10)